MFANLSGWHLLLILALVLLLFGATKLPTLTKSVAQSVRIFRNEMSDSTAKDAGATESPAPGENGKADSTTPDK